MKRLLYCALLVSATIMLQGCLVAPVVPPYGTIYTDFSAPLDWDSDQTQVASKSGSAETVSYVGLVAMGDASIHKAAQNGGLSVVHYADYEYYNLIGIIQRYTTIVYGE